MVVKNMSNNSLIGKERDIDFAEEKTSMRWNVKTLITIPGFVFLSGAISALQNLPKAFATDVDKRIFVDNWMPWIAILFFAFGWFATHGVEIALLKKQIKLARVLFFIVLWLCSLLVSIYLQFFINNEVLHSFGLTAQLLVFSGFFLRYSMCRNESLFRMQKAIFLRKD
jgi:hypothetical protein